jgi:geranylgeranyl pyrophosphate synthase
MLTLAAAKLCGYSGDGHVRLAASVEFMHTATLLHDDVVDESNLRRGKAAARLLWGNEASVLVGDFLLGQAFKMMVDVGSLGCLRILSDAAAVIAEGEVMQLITAKNTETTEDDYLAVIDAKTAALFAAAAEVGAVIAARPKSEAAALRSYGRNLGLAFQLVDDGNPDVLAIFAESIRSLAEGEVLQLSRSFDPEIPESVYLQVVGRKTASLIAACSESGAILAGVARPERRALREYGWDLGLAFQLVDDALDYSGEPSLLGKSVGDDFREGKITLPVVLCYRRGAESERQFWRRTLQDGEIGEDDLAEAFQLMKRHNALSDTMERARHYGAIARDDLAIFPESGAKAALLEAIAFCVERPF